MVSRGSLRGAARPLAAWVALLALVLGGVDLHALAAGHGPAGEELAGHGVLAPLGGDAEVVFACAPEHGRRLHVERARAVERDPCPACLQHLQNRAETPRTHGPVAAVAAGRSVPPPRPKPLAEPAGRLAPSRAPPSR